MKEKLIQLKDRLNDVSKRNRSIRMLKLYDKWAFDISSINKIEEGSAKSLIEKIVAQSDGKAKLVKQNVRSDESLVLSKKLTSLYRNAKAIEEETGLYDMFVGFPYITGAMLDGTYIRAPLFLFPVRLEKEKAGGVQWNLMMEDSEPQLNRSLLLALKKLSGIDVPESLFDEAIEKAKDINFLSWTAWLKDLSLKVEWINHELKSFVNYRLDTLPEYKPGEFELENMAILANFPQGNSALLKDYEDLMELDAKNGELGIAGEFLGAGEDSTSNWNEATMINEEKTIERKEKDKFFVLDTDASQEEILKEIDDEKGMVIHGPPGTGKSQVIVNLIADSIAQGKKVLLVCQKRAALDVVYQRLDSLGLSNHAALLHDEKNDRKKLYSKISNLLEHSQYFEDYEAELGELAGKIERQEEKLNEIAKGLFEVQDHGFKAYELYGITKPFTSIEVILELNAVIDSLNKSNLDDVLVKIFSFGEYYSRFGSDSYPLKDRKSFSKLELKDRLTIVEILKKVQEKAAKSMDYLESFDQDDITPEYSWLVNDKLEKIYEDLNPDEKRSLQKLRLWWWTSFTGKTIVEELLNGEKFNGISSKEWPRLRKSLSILYELSTVSEKMSKEVKSLATYISEDAINKYNDRIAKGDIPAKEFLQQEEYVIQDFEELRNMDRLYEESLPFIKTIIDGLKVKTEDSLHRGLANEWKDIVQQSAYIHWIDQIERKHPSLTKIGTEEFDQLQNSFKQLLKDKRDLSTKVLANRLLKTLNQVKQTNGKSMRELKHQVGKKRMVWTVRKLVRQFSLYGLLDTMPIWLTSPETVSAIFPLEKDLFDVVIFDEASQCTVENGIPAVFRGKKVIVAGDEKQLPPSTLFRGTVDDVDEEDEQSGLSESESLLNLGKRILPEKLLQWHYRSKSEELINFSNHAYYNGNIQTAPNVEPLKDPAAIKWHKVDGRWINQCNEVEAVAVVNLLKELVDKDPSKSIGIITFNSKQQEKIMDIIESEVENDSKFGTVYQQIMSRDLDDRVFVKNIENVQGDERDIIIFSIAYAKNEEGRVYNRFGTLGQQGGENRLNVAVTRAKEQIHMVVSIEPSELNVAATKNEGPKLLKSYLEYSKSISAINRDAVETVLTDINEAKNVKKQNTNDLVFDSPFEEQVYSQLTKLGYKVDTQVGMSGYRIDLSVVHPNNPEKYIIGIECDGAMYHSAASAKERDVYRQRFLESKGWKITRIWSRNWWKNASAEIERIDQIIKEIVRSEELKKEFQY